LLLVSSWDAVSVLLFCVYGARLIGTLLASLILPPFLARSIRPAFPLALPRNTFLSWHLDVQGDGFKSRERFYAGVEELVEDEEL
jgi:hypothetical protein